MDQRAEGPELGSGSATAVTAEMASARAAANAVRRGLSAEAIRKPQDAADPLALMEGMLSDLGRLIPYQEGAEVPLAYILKMDGSRWQGLLQQRGKWFLGGRVYKQEVPVLLAECQTAGRGVYALVWSEQPARNVGAAPPALPVQDPMAMVADLTAQVARLTAQVAQLLEANQAMAERLQHQPEVGGKRSRERPSTGRRKVGETGQQSPAHLKELTPQRPKHFPSSTDRTPPQ